MTSKKHPVTNLHASSLLLSFGLPSLLPITLRLCRSSADIEDKAPEWTTLAVAYSLPVFSMSHMVGAGLDLGRALTDVESRSLDREIKRATAQAKRDIKKHHCY